MKCKVEVLDSKDANEENRALVAQIWGALTDEDYLVYKRALPGEDKQEIKDEL